MLDLLDEIPPRTTRDVNVGVPVVEVTRKAQRKYGWLGGYAETEVMPGLVSRGFYEGQEQRGFWKITRAGESARSELERNLAAHGRERLSLWVDDDPAQALAFLAVAGSSPLLIEKLHPDLRRLRERPQTEAGSYFGAERGAADDDTEAVQGDALGDLDLGALDLGVLDGLDGALSAIDAAVEAGKAARAVGLEALLPVRLHTSAKVGFSRLDARIGFSEPGEWVHCPERTNGSGKT